MLWFEWMLCEDRIVEYGQIDMVRWPRLSIFYQVSNMVFSNREVLRSDLYGHTKFWVLNWVKHSCKFNCMLVHSKMDLDQCVLIFGKISLYILVTSLNILLHKLPMLHTSLEVHILWMWLLNSKTINGINLTTWI